MGKTLAYTMDDVRGNLDDGVENLLGVYAHATAAERRTGINWYADARRDAEDIALRYGLSVRLVAQVAAVLSPQVEWGQNMPAAEDVIRYWLAGNYIPNAGMWTKFGGELPLGTTRNGDEGISSDAMFDHPAVAYRTNQLKALWLLQGHSPDVIVSGDKVKSFVDNILNHETSTAVTVDSHAIQAWFGNMVAGTYSIPSAAYPIIEADYIKAAAIVGLTPLQFQAVVWVTKKRLQESTPLG